MAKNRFRKAWITIIMIIILMLQQSVVNAEEKNNNPMLKNIKINGYSIKPEFEMFTTEYVMTLEENVENIEIEAIPDDKNATVDIVGARNLKIGRNEFEIKVTAENGKNRQSYFLYITRGNSKNANANLKEIKIKGSSELAPSFDKNVINYAFEYPESLEKVEIEAIAEDSEAKVEIIGNENLSEIVQNLQIIVTAKDGQTVKIYYLTAKKAGIEVENSEGKVLQEVEELTSLQEKHKEEKDYKNITMYLIIGIVAIIILVLTIKIRMEKSKKKNEKIAKTLIMFLLGLIFIIGMPGKANAADLEGNLVIVLDPGHGGEDPGTIGGTLREDQVNFKIAYYAKQELEQYEGVKVYLTRYNDCPSIYDRVEIAKSYNADLLVSLHINSGSSSNRGAAIWVTQDDTQIEYKQKAAEVGEKILYNISTLGVQNNGIQIRSGQPDEWYDSGVVQDYYGIIRYAQRVKLRSLLVEHCFISNANDRQYIDSDEDLRKMAQADVKGIVEAYQLKKKEEGFIPIKTMIMEQEELNLQIQDNDLQPVTYLNSIINPNNASNQEIEWYSTNPEVVRVWHGRIRGLQEGEAVIKAISKNNQRIATCKVVVTKPKVPLQNITAATTEQIVNIDEAGDVYIDFYPNDCDDKTLYWISSNPDVVRIWNGHYRGLKEGISIITAYSRAGGKKASCKIIVKSPNRVYVEDIKLEQEEYLVDLDEAVNLPFICEPINSENAEFIWSSSNSEIIRVSGNRFRGLKEGTAEVIVQTTDGMFEKRINVTVKNLNKPYVEDLETEKEKYVINVDEAIDLPYTYTPVNSKNAEFIWNSSNPEILRVWNNRFRGLKEGCAEVIVKTFDGRFEKRIKVVIKNPSKVYVEDIKFEKEEYVVDLDEAMNLPFTYTPGNSENAEFEWVSSNPEILRVSGNRFRGLKEGTAYVIAKTIDGIFEERLKVSIQNLDKPYVQDLQTEEEQYIININDAVDLPYTYRPINSKNAEFVWSSSNPEILRVWNNRFRGLKEGLAEVIVKTFDGRYEEKIKVVIKNPNKVYVEDLKLEKNKFTIKVDEAIDLPYTYTPINSENAEFIWSSSNPEILRVWNNRFRGLKEGTAYILVKTTDGFFEKKIKVTIEK